MASHYDVVVLGAGPGGYVAAIRAAQLGLSVAVVEEKYWGGVCLNVGCIPSKALLRNAELAHIFQHDAKTFGISGEVSFDFGAAFDRSRTVAEGRVKGVHFLMKKNKITEYDGRGTFRDAHTLDVKLADGSTDQVTFDNVIIATGSKVRLLPGVELSENVVTYEKQILTRDLPRSIAIVGAGAIGMEFGYVLKNYGVDVTIIEFLDRALPNEDADVSKEIAKQYKKLGINLLTSTAVQTVKDNGTEGVTVSYKGVKDDKPGELVVDKVRMTSSIAMAPRSVSSTPEFSRPKPSTLGAKPMACSTLSALSSSDLPSLLTRTETVDPSSWIDSTLVLVRTLTPSFLNCFSISLDTSASSIGSARGRNSTTVTSTPKLLRTYPNSMPIAPAPAMMIEPGRSRDRICSS